MTQRLAKINAIQSFKLWLRSELHPFYHRKFQLTIIARRLRLPQNYKNLYMKNLIVSENCYNITVDVNSKFAHLVFIVYSCVLFSLEAIL